MANNFASLVHQKYTNDVQMLLAKQLLSTELADTRFETNLRNGDTFNFQRGIYGSTGYYTKYTDVDDRAVSYSNETLVVDQFPYTSFVMDEVDELQNSINITNKEVTKSAYMIKRIIDGEFFAEYFKPFI